MSGTVPVSEICAALDLSEPTVRKWIAAGMIPGYQLEAKGRIVVPREAWNRFQRGEWTPLTKTVGPVPNAPEMIRRRSA